MILVLTVTAWGVYQTLQAYLQLERAHLCIHGTDRIWFRLHLPILLMKYFLKGNMLVSWIVLCLTNYFSWQNLSTESYLKNSRLPPFTALSQYLSLRCSRMFTDVVQKEHNTNSWKHQRIQLGKEIGQWFLHQFETKRKVGGEFTNILVHQNGFVRRNFPRVFWCDDDYGSKLQPQKRLTVNDPKVWQSLWQTQILMWLKITSCWPVMTSWNFQSTICNKSNQRWMREITVSIRFCCCQHQNIHYNYRSSNKLLMIVYFLGINPKHFHHGYFKNLWDPLGLRNFVVFYSAALAARFRRFPRKSWPQGHRHQSHQTGLGLPEWLSCGGKRCLPQKWCCLAMFRLPFFTFWRDHRCDCCKLVLYVFVDHRCNIDFQGI